MKVFSLFQLLNNAIDVALSRSSLFSVCLFLCFSVTLSLCPPICPSTLSVFRKFIYVVFNPSGFQASNVLYVYCFMYIVFVSFYVVNKFGYNNDFYYIITIMYHSIVQACIDRLFRIHRRRLRGTTID